MYAVSNSIIDTPVHSRPSSAFNLISICAIALIARYVRNPCLRVKGPDKQIQGFDAKKILFQVAVYLFHLSLISPKNLGLRKKNCVLLEYH